MLVESNRVQVNGAFAAKPARLVDRGDSIEIVGERPRFVGRGGDKLEGALRAFDFDPAGLRCLDAGASTGGFTDCLLQNGAREVVAVDVGYGQLHERLVGDGRVTNLERTNVRGIDVEGIGGPVELVVGDLSFISLRTVLDALLGVCVEGASLILLVKPQFEAGRQEASKGRGVIRDPAVWRRVLDEVAEAAHAAGAPVQGAAVSPITGGDGNVEFLYRLAKGATSVDLDLDHLVAGVSVDGERSVT